MLDDIYGVLFHFLFRGYCNSALADFGTDNAGRCKRKEVEIQGPARSQGYNNAKGRLLPLSPGLFGTEMWGEESHGSPLFIYFFVLFIYSDKEQAAQHIDQIKPPELLSHGYPLVQWQDALRYPAVA